MPETPRWQVAEKLGISPTSMHAGIAYTYLQADDERRERMRAGARGIIRAQVEPIRQMAALRRQAAEIPMSPAAERFRDAFFGPEDLSLDEAVDLMLADPGGMGSFLAEVVGESLPQLGAAAVASWTMGPAAGVATLGGLSGATEYGAEIDNFLREQGYDLAK